MRRRSSRAKLLARPQPRVQIRERFYRLVDVRGPDECWPWTGAIDDRDNRDKPYGIWKGFKGTRFAHRIAYMLEHGLDELDPEITVHHTCYKRRNHTPLCCNPAHLEAMEGAQHRSMHAEERWKAHHSGKKPFRRPSGMGVKNTNRKGGK